MERGGHAANGKNGSKCAINRRSGLGQFLTFCEAPVAVAQDPLSLPQKPTVRAGWKAATGHQ
jgi:hypothetical protein